MSPARAAIAAVLVAALLAAYGLAGTVDYQTRCQSLGVAEETEVAR